EIISRACEYEGRAHRADCCGCAPLTTAPDLLARPPCAPKRITKVQAEVKIPSSAYPHELDCRDLILCVTGHRSMMSSARPRIKPARRHVCTTTPRLTTATEWIGSNG